MSILAAIQEASFDLGLDKPLSVVGVNNETAARLLDFAHDTGDDIARRGDWSRMIQTTTATVAPIPLPASFARLVPGGAINITLPSYQRVRGPLSSDGMQAISGGMFGPSSNLYYAFEGGQIVLTRALAGETLLIKWVRKEWLVNGSTYRTRAASDADECLFPERLLTKGLVWRFRRETGLPYEDQLAEWEADIAMELRQDRGVTT